VNTILGAIGVTLANLDNAQITLNTLLLQHPFSTRKELINRLSKHYYMQALRELYKVIGAFDILGSPVSLVNNLGTGVYDFFYEPAQGLVRSPKDFLPGLKRGTMSLVKNSVYGIFNTASKISSSLGKGLATLSMDESYVRERELSRWEKPTNVPEGIASGARDFAIGVYKGVTGIITDPISAIQQDGGVDGLLKGVTKAIVGFAIKPIVGFVDFATKTTQSISHTTSNADKQQKRRFRPPRYIGPDKLLQNYSWERSYGQMILHKLEGSKNQDETYLFHFTIGNNILLVSDQQIIFISRTTLHRKWNLPIKTINRVEKTKDSVIFHLNGIGNLQGSKPQITNRRIHISTSNLLDIIYNRLSQLIQSEKLKFNSM